MPFQYENISSQYLRSRLEHTAWEDHHVIDDLIRLAEIIENGGPHSYAGALLYKYLSDHYPDACDALLGEADTGRQLLYREERQAQEEALALYEDERLRTEQESYASWQRAGGR